MWKVSSEECCDILRFYVDEINLVDGISGFVVAENTQTGTIVGSITILESNSSADISSFVLSSEGSEKFQVLNDGTVVLLEKLDFETKESYTLFLYATTIEENTNSVFIKIIVKEAPLYTVKTNDTTCYNENNASALESDAYYKSGYERSCTDNGNGTVSDNVTGLIWQKEDDNTKRTFDNI